MGKKRRNLLEKIRGDDRTASSYKASPYMTPSLAPRRWSAWMSNTFIAVVILIAGIVLLSLLGEEHDFYLAGWACIGIGAAFLLLSFCWYKSIVSHEESENLVDSEEEPARLQSPNSLNTSTTRLSEEDEIGGGSPPNGMNHQERRESTQSLKTGQQKAPLKSNLKSSTKQGQHVVFK